MEIMEYAAKNNNNLVVYLRYQMTLRNEWNQPQLLFQSLQACCNQLIDRTDTTNQMIWTNNNTNAESSPYNSYHSDRENIQSLIYVRSKVPIITIYLEIVHILHYISILVFNQQVCSTCNNSL